MLSPQPRHLPRSSSQEKSGMLTKALSCVAQPGPFERGLTSDSPRGRRQATTFRNEPMRRPKRAAGASAGGITPPVIGSSPRALDGRCYQVPPTQPLLPPEHERVIGALAVRETENTPPDFDL